MKTLVKILKNNIAFTLGIIVGSTIGTLTTIAITMGYYGTPETLQLYQQMVCP